jgi:hypothetical protein
MSKYGVQRWTLEMRAVHAGVQENNTTMKLETADSQWLSFIYVKAIRDRPACV